MCRDKGAKAAPMSLILSGLSFIMGLLLAFLGESHLESSGRLSLCR